VRLPSLPALALALLLAPAAHAEVPVVATDIPPVQSLVALVMGELGAPVLLMDRGADAHDYQMRPSQARALDGADLLVWIGQDMTPWLQQAAAVRAEGTSLALLDVADTRLRRFAPDNGDDHGTTDPHAWLDPTNAQAWLAAISDALSALDPGNSATYAANAAAAGEAVAALDRDLQARLVPAQSTPIVTEHDAYGYFSDRYGLTVVGSLAAGDAAAPGAARLTAIREAATGAAGSSCIFPEAGHDPRLSEQMASDLGLRLGAPLDPEGAAQEPGPGLYAALLTAMADSIVACAGRN